MTQLDADELLAMLEGNGAEPFRVEGGREIQAVYNAPTVDGNEARGFDPTITCREVDVEEIVRGAIVWRVDPVQRFKVTGRDPIGNGTFIDLHLQAQTA